jgi:hypothetical protein
MNSKFTLALIALVGVGVFALPSTMALFAGQHSFYNIDATGNQVPCQKCHGDVKAELSSGGSTTTGTGGPHAKFQCEYCHRAENGFASGDDAYAKVRYQSDAGDELFLVTTIANYERGNFPKTIDWTSGATVDTWTAWQNKSASQAFVNQTAYDDVNGYYAGSLSNGTNSTAAEFDYDMTWEIGTYNTSTASPKDTNTATQNGLFNPRAVTWTGNSEGLFGAGSREVTPGTKYHAASLVSCLECHGGDQSKGEAGYEVYQSTPYNHAQWVLEDPTACSNCHYGMAPPAITAVKDQLMAGGFGLTDSPNDTGSVEAHNDFVRASGGVLRKGYGAANDACVACHTHVAVDINFQKKYALKFDANAFTSTSGSSTGHGNWSVGGFGAQGTVNVESFGNGTGGAFAIGNHSYNWTPDTNIYLVNPNGTLGGTVSGLSNTANDSSGALSPTP